jgi:hypothetical protein
MRFGLQRLYILFVLFFCINLETRGQENCNKVIELLGRFNLRNEALRTATDTFEAEQKNFARKELVPTYCRELKFNLLDKQDAFKNRAIFTDQDLIARAIRYEAFRLNTYISSGVSPKRYFGFLDEQGSTAEYERIIKSTVENAVEIANAYATNKHLISRITPKEVIVTFLAEGGALILSKKDAELERIDPKLGVGLDDFKVGFEQHTLLIEKFDAHFGTRLKDLVLAIGPFSLQVRPMTFREAVLGTVAMYLYEKELTARYVKSQWHKNLMDLPLDEQFITTSLVYNSGTLFSHERVLQIRDFTTGAYLSEVNEKSARPRLNVYPPQELLEKLKTEIAIPDQHTSWSAVYHILQRFGAWVALEKFSTYFTADGGINRSAAN